MNKIVQIGVGMTTNNIGERERDEYKRETGDGAHIYARKY